MLPKKTLDKYPMATAANSYKYLPEYRSIFPKAFSTPCDLYIINTSLSCDDDLNVPCKEAFSQWPDLEYPFCTKNRYVPPQCVGSRSQWCQEVYHVNPTWDADYFEGVINNTGLNFTVVYLGDSYRDIILNKSTQGESMMFYWFQPDPLILLTKAKAIQFEPNNPECVKKSTWDPRTNQGDCNYPLSRLMKKVRRSALDADTDFRTFYEGFYLYETQLMTMMAQHIRGGGKKNTFQVACDWIKENPTVWMDWVRNTPPPTSMNQNMESELPVVAYAVPVGVLSPFLVAFTVYLGFRFQRNKLAPKKPPMCIVFTDIESSTTLWQRFPVAMAHAIEVHNKLIRAQIKEFGCYEVKTIGDSFMIACPSVVEGTMLALEIQLALWNYQEWHDDLSDFAGVAKGPSKVWNGLRVRTGVHHATQVMAKYEAIHTRYDY
eukprot:PhF_6_TR10614/c0_g2_i4/m.17130